VSRTEKLIKAVMWRNILPQVAYQVTVMIILMFARGAMFDLHGDKMPKDSGSINIVTDKLRFPDNTPTGRLRKDTLCFHTFMLMNIINMVNCRVVNEEQNNVFITLGIRSSKMFWMIFLLELIVQNAFVWLPNITSGPFKVCGALLGTGDMPFTMHITAWVFGLFVLAIRPATN